MGFSLINHPAIKGYLLLGTPGYPDPATPLPRFRRRAQAIVDLLEERVEKMGEINSLWEKIG